MSLRVVLFASLVVMLIAAGFAFADGVPTVTPLTYSGVLQNSAGAPVTTAQALQLTLWDDATANASANQKCVTPTQSITPDSQGRFQVLLDQACYDAVRANPNLWVQLQVGAVVMPRVKLGAVPYAVESGRAVDLGEPAQQRLLPTGSIVAFGGSTAPAGWVLCDGATYSQTDPRFAALFAAIGTTYGAGSSAGLFRVPDLRGRSLLGAGTGPGLRPRTAGQVLGAEDITAQAMPTHSHTGTTGGAVRSGSVRVVASPGLGIDPNHVTGYTPQPPFTDIQGGVAGNHTHAFTTDPAGGSTNDGNVQPSLVSQFIIRL
jgi:microcystin-dependent protein